jgi:hypothetical protein
LRLRFADPAHGGETRRESSRAWREYDLRELEKFASPDRAHRYRTHLGRVAKVLPPAVRPFVAVLALNHDAPIALGRSYQLRDEDRVAALQHRCQLRLAGREMKSNDRKRLAETLKLIDPCSVRLVSETGALRVGDVAALNATAGAAGSWIAGPSAAGHPGIGLVAEDGTVQPFETTFYFNKEPL